VLNGESNNRVKHIFVFGIPDDRDVAVWRCKVDDALQFIVGRVVDADDMYRKGALLKAKPVQSSLNYKHNGISVF
jgi:hypothetical protein